MVKTRKIKQKESSLKNKEKIIEKSKMENIDHHEDDVDDCERTLCQ